MDAGFRSLAAFWMGGASVPPIIVVPPSPEPGGCGGGGGPGRSTRAFLRDYGNKAEAVRADDEEVLEFIKVWVAWYANQD